MQVLHLDDEPLILSATHRFFRPEIGFRHIGVTTVELAVEHFAQKPDVALLDLDLGVGTVYDGFRFLEIRNKKGLDFEVIVYSGYLDSANERRALSFGHVHIASKTLPVLDLMDLVLRVAPTCAACGRAATILETSDLPLPAQLAAIRALRVERALAKCGHNVTQAADMLKIKRQMVKRKRKL